MAKFILNVAIIFLLIAECIGPRDQYMSWTESLNSLLMNIYYVTYPPDEHHWERIKGMWDQQVPHYSFVNQQTLEKHIYDMKLDYWKTWLNHSGTEREQMEDTLINIYKDTNNGHPQHAKRILEELLKIRPKYQDDYELIRTVVYRWYERFTPLGKEIMARDVDWTPQRKADLMHIAHQVKDGVGHLHARIKERWSKMHKHLNVSEHTLSDHAYKLRKRFNHEPSMKEKLVAEKKYRTLFHSEAHETYKDSSVEKGKKVRWTDEMKADIMHIDDEIRAAGLNLAAAIKDRWDRMQKNHTHFSGDTLIARSEYLHKTGYTPQIKSVQDAKRRYEALPPIPPEVLSKRTARRKSRQIPIRGGYEFHQRHQDDPLDLDFELTPEQMSWFQQDMEDINASYTRHAHHPHHTPYYGSSSHTSIVQGSFGSLPDTLHPQHYQWYPGESSSHIPTDQASSSTQPHFQNPYDHQLYLVGSSSHTPIDQGHFAPLPDTPRPQLNPWYPGGSSNHTHQASSSTQPHFPNLYNRQWHPGSSSNYSQHPPQQ